ncbi:MAG: MerR family transcriptional regulator [Acidimicrobiales bacterium]
MGERSYLAIGDVLALLRDEFPDITISKIRFLESRGLLDPERTPSGYRKFYESDVDRLRWILRQQREHFLPLKVIKGRLENGMTDPDAPTPHLFEMGDPPPEPEAQPVLVGVPGGGQAAEERALAALAPMAAVAGSSERTTNRTPTVVLGKGESPPAANEDQTPALAKSGDLPEVRQKAATGASPGADEAGVASSSSRRRRAPAGVAGPEPAAKAVETARRGPETSPEPGAHARPAAQGSAQAKAAPAEAKAAAEAGEGAESGDEETKEASTAVRRVPSRPTAGLPGAGLSGASFTLAELAHASGLELAGVEELESFGLIAGRTVAGVHCYDEEAVLVAKLAARFSAYGIEARHLKVFKHASDRQTGLFSQVVTPLLRQRNPEARARAIEDLSELAELGEALMRCFSQATLRELTGG